MIAFPPGVKVWIAGGVTDMRCGMNSLALKVQEGLGRDPHGGEVFCFRGRKGDLIKVLWHDGVGMSLYLKRLEAGSWKVYLARQPEWLRRASVGGATRLSPGRDRLAQSTLDAAAFEGGLTACTALFLLVFQRVAW